MSRTYHHEPRRYTPEEVLRAQNERFAYNFARNAPESHNDVACARMFAEKGHAWWEAMEPDARKAVMRAFDRGFVNPRIRVPRGGAR